MIVFASVKIGHHKLDSHCFVNIVPNIFITGLRAIFDYFDMIIITNEIDKLHIV